MEPNPDLSSLLMWGEISFEVALEATKFQKEVFSIVATVEIFLILYQSVQIWPPKGFC